MKITRQPWYRMTRAVLITTTLKAVIPAQAGIQVCSLSLKGVPW